MIARRLAQGAIALSIWAALCFAAMHALYAQSIGPVAGQGPGNIGPPFTVQNGHFSYGNFPPPVANAGCGTGAVITGSDGAFVLTSGTSSSSACIITFIFGWNRRPICSVDAQAASQPNFSVTTTGVLLSGVADSTVYNISCVGQPGG